MTKVDPVEVLRGYRRDRRLYIEGFFKITPRETWRGMVEMRLNRVQRDYWGTRTARDVYVKARRVTVSSVIEADYTSMAMLNSGVRVLVVLQKPLEDTLAHHMPRVRGFYRSVPEQLRPELVVDNVSTLEFEFGREAGAERRSRIDFVSSGSREVLRGGGYDFIHITELPSFEEEEVDALLDALMGLGGDVRVAIESTPRRLGDPLHKIYQGARERRNAFTPHMYPWFWVEEFCWPAERALPANAPEEWGGEFEYTAEEAELVGRHGLSQEQVRWWRLMLLEAHGDEQRRASEYLTDDVTCWALSGTPAMPQEVVSRLLGQARAPLPVEALPDRNDYGGRLRVWLPPQPGESYVMFCDPAEGNPTSHDTAVVVRRVRDWAHCATLCGKLSPEEVGGIMVEMGRRWNNALLGWERNSIGAGVRATVVGKHHYPHCYRYTADNVDNADERYGFPTNRFTKEAAVLALAEFMRSGAYHTWDARLLEQHRALQSVGEGKYNTELLDIGMADILCLQARGQGMRQAYQRPQGISRLPRFLQQVTRERERRDGGTV